MTLMQWMTLIVLFCWPVLWHLASPLAIMLARKLPEGRRMALMQFAEMSTRRVEQTAKNLPNDAKKQLALTIVISLFKAFHVPLPPDDILETAIESAVSLLPKTNEPVQTSE